MLMRDPSGRPVRSLRISVTARCDLRCTYCHNEGQRGAGGREMSPAEIARIVRVAKTIGIERVKLTGGEPLARDDIEEIVMLAIGIVGDVSMTTNGTTLARSARVLKAAGLSRVNVSLDTIDRARYTALTGVDRLDDVVAGVKEAIAAGLSPVKVNIVALPDSGVSEVERTMEEAWRLGAIPQVIQPVGGGVDSATFDEVERRVAGRARKTVERELHCRKKYYILGDDGAEREAELVRPMHNTRFCANCTRLRVTSDGMLKPCLMHDEGRVDVLTPMRAGASDDELLGFFAEAINNRRPYWV